jgi:hypothetical protein
MTITATSAGVVYDRPAGRRVGQVTDGHREVNEWMRFSRQARRPGVMYSTYDDGDARVGL